MELWSQQFWQISEEEEEKHQTLPSPKALITGDALASAVSMPNFHSKLQAYGVLSGLRFHLKPRWCWGTLTWSSESFLGCLPDFEINHLLEGEGCLEKSWLLCEFDSCGLQKWVSIPWWGYNTLANCDDISPEWLAWLATATSSVTHLKKKKRKWLSLVKFCSEFSEVQKQKQVQPKESERNMPKRWAERPWTIETSLFSNANISPDCRNSGTTATPRLFTGE